MSQAELLHSDRRLRFKREARTVQAVPPSTPAVSRQRARFQPELIDADRFLVDSIRPYPEWPLICNHAHLPAFETEAEAMKWNDANGHFPVLAKWTCSHCWCVHFWPTSQTDSNGAFASGAGELPARIKELMK